MDFLTIAWLVLAVIVVLPLILSFTKHGKSSGEPPKPVSPTEIKGSGSKTSQVDTSSSDCSSGGSDSGGCS